MIIKMLKDINSVKTTVLEYLIVLKALWSN